MRDLRVGARDFGLGGRGLGFERLRIDDEHCLAGLHPAALGVQALLEDAADACAHLDRLRARVWPTYSVADGQRLRLQHCGVVTAAGGKPAECRRCCRGPQEATSAYDGETRERRQQIGARKKERVA